ncbi:MAG TPA: glucose/quinate/shikimate family membrane-bound PQQ-dependent dehydrogenase [Rhodocyclaceae bacterium]|nr:glucose/quinate/shikimate family membrane-bound PQQ-dependent dehydrogenase [Rhodocyclaceae bacterium]
MEQNSHPSRIAPAIIFTGAVLCLLGLALALGGIRLVSLGGSWYYVLAGLGIVITAILLLTRRREAFWLYAFVLLATVVWAVAEVQFDWWQLVPRISLWFLIALWLLTPWIADAFYTDAKLKFRSITWPLWFVVVITIVVGLIGAFSDYYDRPGQLALQGSTSAASAAPTSNSGDWPTYGGSPGGDRYSVLTQITPQNASQLKMAWRFETGDKPGPGDPTETTDENTPLKIGNSLFICSPHSKVYALDASTGKERWHFDPHITSPVGFKHFEHMTCRGVSYHDDANYPAASASSPSSAATSSACQRRLFLPTADARLIALDADNGKVCDDFGSHGTVNLRTSVGPFKPGGYYSTSPPAITRNLVIIGGHVSDNVSNNEPSGVIRAYDVHDGHLVWNWDAGKPDQTAPLPPGQIYTRNSPNMWSVFSVDESLGLLYLPMGNQTPDQWGGQRTPESERLSAGVVALDVATGRLRWVHQFTHHDLWDMDVGGQPSLADIQTANGMTPALIASTKQGSIYVLDRRTGEAIVPITEIPRPRDTVPDDHASPTQPMSALTFSPPDIHETDMWGSNPYDQLWCRIKFRSLHYEGMFTPPSIQGSLVFPGNFGVFDWGGVSIDPVHQILIANPSYMAFESRLIPKSDSGKSTEDKEASDENNGIKRVGGIPYDFELKPFLSPLGIPCQAPPWGYVAGVDLKTNKIAWQHKNGTIRDSSPIPVPIPLGVPSLGGTIVTAGGVAFLSGTLDYYVRAYDISNGKVLWKARLPAGGQSTPMTYSDGSGKQYVVVTAGGHGSLGTKQGDYVIAYSLP